ncbi:hypothetical protein D3C84_1281810 [compost metagenome]
MLALSKGVEQMSEVMSRHLYRASITLHLSMPGEDSDTPWVRPQLVIDLINTYRRRDVEEDLCIWAKDVFRQHK